MRGDVENAFSTSRRCKEYSSHYDADDNAAETRSMNVAMYVYVCIHAPWMHVNDAAEINSWGKRRTYRCPHTWIYVYIQGRRDTPNESTHMIIDQYSIWIFMRQYEKLVFLFFQNMWTLMTYYTSLSNPMKRGDAGNNAAKTNPINVHTYVVTYVIYQYSIWTLITYYTSFTTPINMWTRRKRRCKGTPSECAHIFYYLCYISIFCMNVHMNTHDCYTSFSRLHEYQWYIAPLSPNLSKCGHGGNDAAEAHSVNVHTYVITYLIYHYSIWTLMTYYTSFSKPIKMRARRQRRCRGTLMHVHIYVIIQYYVWMLIHECQWTSHFIPQNIWTLMKYYVFFSIYQYSIWISMMF